MMKQTSMKRILSLLVCMVLIAAMALGTVSCGIFGGEEETEAPLSDQKSFTFVVIDASGKETTFDVHTNKAKVGDALIDEGLLEGEEGPYGLYVKKVNGIVADYDVDGSYWSFYINGEYAMTGVDQTDVIDGATYTMQYTK